MSNHDGISPILLKILNNARTTKYKRVTVDTKIAKDNIYRFAIFMVMSKVIGNISQIIANHC